VRLDRTGLGMGMVGVFSFGHSEFPSACNVRRQVERRYLARFGACCPVSDI